MENKPLSEKLANDVYDILVEVCGACESMRQAFVYTETHELCSEYRFCGRMGFGGKFWNANDRLYVNCYSEDETPQRRAMIAEANKRLAALNRCVITLEMPAEAAERFLKGWREKDPKMLELIEEFGLTDIMPH